MIEVFKTNVTTEIDALLIVQGIQRLLPGHVDNFDLEDCDHILRVQCQGKLLAKAVIRTVHAAGFHAEILPDEVDHSGDVIFESNYPARA